jgi:hypothetical protein
MPLNEPKVSQETKYHDNTILEFSKSDTMN